ncbi:MAG: MgtC/SapB family protein [Ruthenibacterium sp.]
MLALRELTHVSILVRMLCAIIVGGALGLERGRKNRPAGLRTYMLVCLGSAIVMMTNQYVVQAFGTGDPVRMGAQVISGIGFLGAGSIMVTQRNQIRGLTTAAGLWAAACVGLAIGIGLYEVAVLGGLLIFIVLTLLHKLDFLTRKNSNLIDVYIELDSKDAMGGFIRFARDAGMEISNLQLEHDYYNSSHGPCFIVTIKSVVNSPHDTMLDALRHVPHLQFLEEL